MSVACNSRRRHAVIAVCGAARAAFDPGVKQWSKKASQNERRILRAMAYAPGRDRLGCEVARPKWRDAWRPKWMTSLLSVRTPPPDGSFDF